VIIFIVFIQINCKLGFGGWRSSGCCFFFRSSFCLCSKNQP